MPAGTKNHAALGLLGMATMSRVGQAPRRPWLRRIGGAAVALAVLAVPVACSGDDDDGADSAAADRTTSTSTTASDPSTTTAPPTTGSGPCGLSDAAADVTFSAGRNGGTLHAVVAGEGTTALVLAHEAQEDACMWAPFVPELATGGRSVLAFDFSGDGSSDDIGDGRLDLDLLAAVAEARHRGATKVVAIGASKGGTAALAAAATPGSGIDGVVSLSAVASYLNTDAEAAAADITVPVLFAAAESDGSTAEVARAVADACGCAYPDVLVVAGNRHGHRLLTDDDAGPELGDAIDQLIAHATG
jgi:alpha/beta hydrolase family protein